MGESEQAVGFMLPNAFTGRAWPGQSRELELIPGLLCKWQGRKYLNHHLLPYRKHISKKLELGVQLRL